MRIAAASAAVVLLGALPRLALAAGALPSFLGPFVWSDILLTWERGISGGRVPYWNSYFEYPPLDGYLSALFGALAATPLAYLGLWTVVQMTAAAIVGWSLKGDGRPGWWGWAVAPQLALFGPMNFDLLAVAALVLALRWERAQAPLRSTIALATGTAAKLFPAVILPLTLLRIRRDPRAVAVRLAVFGGLLGACYAPGALAPFSTFESLTRYSLGIAANFDSIWGIAGAIIAGTGLPAATVIPTVTLIGLLVTYLIFVVPQAWSARDPMRSAASAVLVLLLWSRLYSPQFSLWVLPFFALAGLPFGVFALLTLADIGVFLTVYPLTLVDVMTEAMRTSLTVGLVAAVVLRHAALVLAARAAMRRGAPTAARFSAPLGPRRPGPRSDASAL